MIFWLQCLNSYLRRMKFKTLPLGDADFEDIIKKNKLYVDKTEEVYKLINRSKPNFLSRPRRFGKSLLVSILEHIFLGNKELFKGLWIYDKIEWTSRPVIKLSLVELDYQTTSLEKALSRYFDDLAKKHQVELEKTTAKEKFAELITLVSVNGKVAVLIDEYDKPIIDFIDDIKKATDNRDTLKSVYGILKGNDIETKIHFIFITGVSKFSKTSIFSELNNLTDLTLHAKHATLVGITQKELESYFGGHIEEYMEIRGQSREQVLKEIKRWYNGYSWDGKNFVYNPYSLLNFLDQYEFKNYWFESGTPSFLIKVIQRQKIPFKEVNKVRLRYEAFSVFELEDMDIYPLFFQTGYLTIKKKNYSRGGRLVYELAYPNFEIKESFLHNLLEAYAFQKKGTVNQALLKMEDALDINDMETFVAQLKILFSDISYHLHPTINKKNPTSADKAKLFRAWEGYFHSIIYLIIKFLGIQIDIELSKHKGRIDAKIEVDNYLYIMEFKMDASTQKALDQIESQKYVEAFKNTSKEIILVGISFDSKECNVKDWETKSYS